MILAKCRHQERQPMFPCCLEPRNRMPHTCSAPKPVYLLFYVCLLFYEQLFHGPLYFPSTSFFPSQISFHKHIIFKLKPSGPCLCSVSPMWLSCPGWWPVCFYHGSLCAKLELSPQRRLTGTFGKQQHFLSAQTLLLGL